MPILVKVQGVPGTTDIKVQGYNDGAWFVANSFSFGIDRELRESGEHGGTEDINIGVGDFSEVVITKALNGASPRLAQFGVNGNSPGEVEIHFVNGPNQPRVSLMYKLNRAFVKSWSTAASGEKKDGAEEVVAFYFNRIAFVVAGQPAAFSWDKVTNTAWTEHGLPTLPALS
jgi:type VI protein secretion system component Hcp